MDKELKLELLSFEIDQDERLNIYFKLETESYRIAEIKPNRWALQGFRPPLSMEYGLQCSIDNIHTSLKEALLTMSTNPAKSLHAKGA